MTLLLCYIIQPIVAINYVLNYSLSDFQIENSVDGANLIPLREDFVMLEDSTLPALPMNYVNILLPEGTGLVSCNYSIIEQNLVTGVSSVRNNLPLTPTDTMLHNIQHNPALTQQISIYPIQNVSLIAEKQYGGYNYVTLQVCPFTYYTNSSLYFISQIQVSIEIDTIPIPTIDEPANIDMFRRTLLNPELLPELVAPLYPQQKIDYVIISPDSLKLAYQPLVNWKTMKGVKTQIVTLEEIYANYTDPTPQLKIKRCLYDYYINHGTKWVLLGGDDTLVPVMGCYGNVNGNKTYIDNNIPCDLFYACFCGSFDWNANGNSIIGEPQDGVNLIPNVYISRLPIRTRKHIENYVKKLLSYEQKPPIRNYVKRLLLCGRHLWTTFPNGKSDAELKSELFYNTFIQPNWNGTKYRFYDSDTDFGGSSYNLTPNNINAQLNAGYHFMHYESHGSYDLWATETGDYTPYYVQQLENDTSLSVIVTGACLTNKFDDASDPCLSEAFIRHNGGAICYFGSSRYGWGYKNYNINAITIGPSLKYNGGFFNSLFGDSITHFAETAAYAKMALISSSNYNGAFRWLQFSLNPIGDPELPIYTEDPIHFSGVSVTKTGNNVIVNTNGTAHCSITIISANDYGETYFNTHQNVSSAVFQDVPEPFFVTITKQNYVPYVYSSVLYLQNETYIDEQIITNVGKVIAGETVTDTKPQGKVVVQQGGKLEIQYKQNVLLDRGFEVKLGGQLDIHK